MKEVLLLIQLVAVLSYRKEVKPVKSGAKPGPKPKDAVKSPKAAKSKEKSANEEFEFDEVEAEPEAKKQKTTPTKGNAAQVTVIVAASLRLSEHYFPGAWRHTPGFV